MLNNTSRRARRHAQVRTRLAQLVDYARGQQRPDDLPDDQHWVDVSDPPGADLPASRPAGRPRGQPWWRRGRPGRLVERWVPGGAGHLTGWRRLPALVALAVAVGAAVAAGVVLSSGAVVREPAPNLPAAVSSATSRVDHQPGGRTIVVSVVGRVVSPGLVTLPDGSRVADAVRAAGGAIPGADLSGLNIARRIADGEQIYVGVPAPPEAPAAGGTPHAAGGGKIDLNLASVAQLDTLPGVGQITAQRIVDWRTKHGSFTRVEQLREIDGIGPARYAELKELVVVR